MTMKIFAVIALLSISAAGFAADGIAGDSGNSSVLIWALLLVSLAAVISTSAVFYLAWRRESTPPEIGVKTESASPEEWEAGLQSVRGSIENLEKMLDKKSDAGAGAIKEFEERLQSNSAAVLADTKNTLQKIRELFDGYMIFQKTLDEKDAEIKRLKDGYDAEIFRRFLYRFIRIDKTIKDPETPKNALESLRLIQGLFEDALDECGVEKFSPEIGEDYRKAFGVADRPENEPTEDAGKNFLISEVLAEGYMLKSDGGREAVVPAKVKIFKHQKEN